MNHFELFGLPFLFALDNQELSTQFRELQRHFHPDNFAMASERDRMMAMQKAAQINDAFQTLKIRFLVQNICFLNVMKTFVANKNATRYGLLDAANGASRSVRSYC